MKKLLFLIIIILAACGGEEMVQETECVGLEGMFIGIPMLDANTCEMSPWVLRPTSLNATNLPDDKKVCGTHELLTEVNDKDICTREVTNSLAVQEDGYVGFVILEVKCPRGLMGCASVWRVEFAPHEP